MILKSGFLVLDVGIYLLAFSLPPSKRWETEEEKKNSQPIGSTAVVRINQLSRLTLGGKNNNLRLSSIMPSHSGRPKSKTDKSTYTFLFLLNYRLKILAASAVWDYLASWSTCVGSKHAAATVCNPRCYRRQSQAFWSIVWKWLLTWDPCPTGRLPRRPFWTELCKRSTLSLSEQVSMKTTHPKTRVGLPNVLI